MAAAFAATGGVMLVRPEILAQAGGLEAVRCAVAGMAFVHLAPLLLALHFARPANALAFSACVLMAASNMPAFRFYGLGPIRYRHMRAFALPIVAACYTWFIMRSAWRRTRARRRVEGSPSSGETARRESVA